MLIKCPRCRTGHMFQEANLMPGEFIITCQKCTHTFYFHPHNIAGITSTGEQEEALPPLPDDTKQQDDFYLPPVYEEQETSFFAGPMIPIADEVTASPVYYNTPPKLPLLNNGQFIIHTPEARQQQYLNRPVTGPAFPSAASQPSATPEHPAALDKEKKTGPFDNLYTQEIISERPVPAPVTSSLPPKSVEQTTLTSLQSEKNKETGLDTSAPTQKSQPENNRTQENNQQHMQPEPEQTTPVSATNSVPESDPDKNKDTAQQKKNTEKTSLQSEKNKETELDTSAPTQKSQPENNKTQEDNLQHMQPEP